MNDIEHSNFDNPLTLPNRHRRSQRISPSPEPQLITAIHRLSPPKAMDIRSFQAAPTQSTGETSPLDLSKHTPPPSDPLVLATGDHDTSSSQSSTSTLIPKKNLSTSDLDPAERKKQSALTKVQAKLDKAQRLYQSAQQSVEQNISEFLRVTTIPGIVNEPSSSKMTNAAFDKRIRTLQETKKELEKKIHHYQADLVRIQAGDIPNQYSSSKDILTTIKSRVSSGTSKNRSSHDVSIEPTVSLQVHEPDSHPPQSTGATPHQNLSAHAANSNTLDAVRSSPSNSICHEIGNSQFYIDSASDVYDYEKSPSTKRRFTDDSTNEFNDRISDQSSDDRYISHNSSKQNTMMTHDYHQLTVKIDVMQKTVDRYETKFGDLQRQIEALTLTHDAQREHNERLNNELTDLTDLHQLEMLSMRTDLRKLEDKLLYNFNEYWGEMVEKLDKLDTRTSKVEQTQIYSLETEENTHRIISKLVNILLTVFAIILLLLSTIKNLIQSRVHAVIVLILVFIWITIHYLPENYFQAGLLQNFTSVFKRIGG